MAKENAEDAEFTKIFKEVMDFLRPLEVAGIVIEFEAEGAKNKYDCKIVTYGKGSSLTSLQITALLYYLLLQYAIMCLPAFGSETKKQLKAAVLALQDLAHSGLTDPLARVNFENLDRILDRISD